MDDPLGQLRLRFAGLRLVREDRHAQVYAGKDFAGYEVTVAVLAEAAAADPATRRGFAEAAGRLAAGAGPSVQSDPRATRPWLAARHPEGPARVARLVAELGGASRPPDSPAALAPLPVDLPLPVRPDPTFAPSPPPAGFEPVPRLLPPPPPPSAPPVPAPISAPAPRSRPARSRPVPPPHPTGPPGPAVPRGRSVQSQQFPPAAVVALVVIGVLVLLSCVGALVG